MSPLARNFLPESALSLQDMHNSYRLFFMDGWHSLGQSHLAPNERKLVVYRTIEPGRFDDSFFLLLFNLDDKVKLLISSNKQKYDIVKPNGVAQHFSQTLFFNTR